MSKLLVGILLIGLAVAGCAKKEPPKEAETQVARKYLIEGTVYLKQGDPVKAVESFATAIKTEPNSFDGYLMLSETFLRLKQFPQAVGVMTSAVRQFPDNALAYYLLSVSYEGAGQLVPAIVSARRSVELYTAEKDKVGVQKSSVLLATLVAAARQQAENDMVANAAADGQKALESAVGVVASPQGAAK